MKMIRKFLCFAVAFAVIVTTVNPMTAEAVSKKKPALNKKSVTLTITNKKKAPAVTLKVKNAKAKKVKWTTSNKKVAAIKKTGKQNVKVTAKKAGKAKITCKVNGRKLTCKINVKDTRKTKSNNNNKTTEPSKTKCNHEWVAKWTVYEHEGDYNSDAIPCCCGVFASEEELQNHFFVTSTNRRLFDPTAMEDETGIHGTKAKGKPVINVNANRVQHISIRREYIEYYYCTKCNAKLGHAWDGPKEQ